MKISILLTGCFQKPENTSLKYLWEGNPENINKVGSEALIQRSWGTGSTQEGKKKREEVAHGGLNAIRLA